MVSVTSETADMARLPMKLISLLRSRKIQKIMRDSERARAADTHWLEEELTTQVQQQELRAIKVVDMGD